MTASGVVFPTTALKQSVRKPVSVELKNGTTYNGVLISADKWMNLDLQDVICTAASAEQFWKMREVCIRGNSIRTVRVVDEAVQPPKPVELGKRNMSREERARKYGARTEAKK